MSTATVRRFAPLRAQSRGRGYPGVRGRRGGLCRRPLGVGVPAIQGTIMTARATWMVASWMFSWLRSVACATWTAEGTGMPACCQQLPRRVW